MRRIGVLMGTSRHDRACRIDLFAVSTATEFGAVVRPCGREALPAAAPARRIAQRRPCVWSRQSCGSLQQLRLADQFLSHKRQKFFTSPLARVDNPRTSSPKYLPKMEHFMKVHVLSSADLNTGFDHFMRGDFQAALREFRLLANRGHADAQFNLGSMYYNGTGVPKDLTQAAKWYLRSAENGQAISQFNVGTMFFTGTGFSKDLAAAASWFRKSAEQGYPAAQLNLGAMYASGCGLPQDFPEAITWYQNAAEQGDGLAQYNLAAMFFDGLGVPKDPIQAFSWFFLAAENGVREATNRCMELQDHMSTRQNAAAREFIKKLCARLSLVPSDHVTMD